jgi:hypothetical protein
MVSGVGCFKPGLISAVPQVVSEQKGGGPDDGSRDHRNSGRVSGWAAAVLVNWYRWAIGDPLGLIVLLHFDFLTPFRTRGMRGGMTRVGSGSVAGTSSTPQAGRTRLPGFRVLYANSSLGFPFPRWIAAC